MTFVGQSGSVGLERPGDEGAEAARLVLELADPAHVLDALFERLDVPVHHRRRRRDAEPVRFAHDAEPVGRLRLLRRDDVAHAVDEDLRSASGDRVEARVAQPRQCLGDRELGAACDVLDLGRREHVQVNAVPLLDRAEEILVELDAEVRVMAALHEERGAADRQRLLDLLEDDRLRKEVALAAVARTAVEGAEVAVRVADVRVVDVPVDDERHAPRVDPAVAKLIGRAADANEVAAPQEHERVLVVQPLPAERAVEDLGDGAAPTRMPVAGAVAGHADTVSGWTKRSSGTRESSPTSRASSKNVISPARSRGPKL